MIAREAVKREKFADKLSVDDMIGKYEAVTGVKFGVEDEQYSKRVKVCQDVLKDKGVVTTKVRIKQLPNHVIFLRICI